MASASAALPLAGGALLAATLLPALAAGQGRWARAACVGGGAILGGAGILAALLGSPSRVLTALLPLAGFAVAVVGTARLLRRAGAPSPAAAGLSGLLGCSLLVLPFLGDALVEPGSPGRSSPAAVRALLLGSPLAASVGGGLGVDFLRAPLSYGGASGEGLSRIGAYHPSPYPDPLVSGLGFALAGGLLLGASGLVRRRPAG